MKNYRARGSLRLVRNFLFSKTNREFLIFLFFLCLSGVFWLLMALNETYEKEFSIPVQLVNVPKNVVITDDLPGSIRVTAKDKGFVILTYLYGQTLRPITVDFKTYTTNGSGHAVIVVNELLKQITSQLNGSSKITSIKPETIEFFYSYGLSKRVPVKLDGRIIPEKMYYLAKVRFWPDSVTIYASKHLLDSIKEAYTIPINRRNLSDTTIFKTSLRQIRGVKYTPAYVKVGLFTDIFTEESVDVPIQGINMPEGKILRTFPSKVSVSFTTGVSVFKQIRPEDFTVVVDYNDISEHPSDKCNLYIRAIPHGVGRVNLGVKQVDYLIEQE